mmetsp:Transcript_61072/g.175219  ORF Transcript_61072/g.175219 Transcript_61072/m.175219 type:complete len:342 (+) Transcript_61072:593-1618(+)
MLGIAHCQGEQQVRYLAVRKHAQIWQQGLQHFVQISSGQKSQPGQRMENQNELPGGELVQPREDELGEAPQQGAAAEAEAREDSNQLDRVPRLHGVEVVPDALQGHVHQLPVIDTPATEGLQQGCATRGIELLHLPHRLRAHERRGGPQLPHGGDLASARHGDSRGQGVHAVRGQGEREHRQVPRLERILALEGHLCRTLQQRPQLRRWRAHPRGGVRRECQRPPVAGLEPRGQRSNQHVEATVGLHALECPASSGLVRKCWRGLALAHCCGSGARWISRDEISEPVQGRLQRGGIGSLVLHPKLQRLARSPERAQLPHNSRRQRTVRPRGIVFAVGGVAT